MALLAAPSGLSPVGTLSGAPFNEQGRLYYIPNDTSNTYAIGDIVVIGTGSDANGVTAVTKYVQGTTTLPPLGVIVGIRVADPGVSLQGTNLNLGQVFIGKGAGAHYVYVVDDPNVIFEAQFDSTGVSAAHLHYLCSTNQAADQSSTLSQSAPYSSTALTGPTATYSANTTILQILGAVQTPTNQGALGAVSSSTAVPYLSVLVKWNQHQYFGAAAGV